MKRFFLVEKSNHWYIYRKNTMSQINTGNQYIGTGGLLSFMKYILQVFNGSWNEAEASPEELIRKIDDEINETESAIKVIMDDIGSPILTIPGISYRMGAMIIAELGDISRFNSPDKILAYAGMSPSTYQSGQLTSSYAHMEKRGSRYLRYALFNATKFVCIWDESFAKYLAKKQSEGKHYNVAVSHAAKKLVRLMFHLINTGEAYIPAA